VPPKSRSKASLKWAFSRFPNRICREEGRVGVSVCTRLAGAMPASRWPGAFWTNTPALPDAQLPAQQPPTALTLTPDMEVAGPCAREGVPEWGENSTFQCRRATLADLRVGQPWAPIERDAMPSSLEAAWGARLPAQGPGSRFSLVTYNGVCHPAGRNCHKENSFPALLRPLYVPRNWDAVRKVRNLAPWESWGAHRQRGGCRPSRVQTSKSQ